MGEDKAMLHNMVLLSVCLFIHYVSSELVTEDQR